MNIFHVVVHSKEKQHMYTHKNLARNQCVNSLGNFQSYLLDESIDMHLIVGISKYPCLKLNLLK